MIRHRIVCMFQVITYLVLP